MADLVMMRCDRIELTLSTAGCARLFRKAADHDPAPWEAKSACRFCPVGAANAGVTVAPMAKARHTLKAFCPRCQRPGLRLISGHYCVSCYNRTREVVAGVDAKGKRPGFADAVHTEIMCVAEGDAVEVRVAPRVSSRLEAMLAMAKRATAPMHFGVAPLNLEAAMPLVAA